MGSLWSCKVTIKRQNGIWKNSHLLAYLDYWYQQMQHISQYGSANTICATATCGEKPHPLLEIKYDCKLSKKDSSYNKKWLGRWYNKTMVIFDQYVQGMYEIFHMSLLTMALCAGQHLFLLSGLQTRQWSYVCQSGWSTWRKMSNVHLAFLRVNGICWRLMLECRVSRRLIKFRWYVVHCITGSLLLMDLMLIGNHKFSQSQVIWTESSEK